MKFILVDRGKGYYDIILLGLDDFKQIIPVVASVGNAQVISSFNVIKRHCSGINTLSFVIPIGILFAAFVDVNTFCFKLGCSSSCCL